MVLYNVEYFDAQGRLDHNEAAISAEDAARLAQGRMMRLEPCEGPIDGGYSHSAMCHENSGDWGGEG